MTLGLLADPLVIVEYIHSYLIVPTSEMSEMHVPVHSFSLSNSDINIDSNFANFVMLGMDSMQKVHSVFKYFLTPLSSMPAWSAFKLLKVRTAQFPLGS
jgi:hypothetical protein